MALRRVTEAEIAAANLRRMARDLILEAERLEATACVPSERSTGHDGPGVYTRVCPLTGKKKKVVYGKLPKRNE